MSADAELHSYRLCWLDDLGQIDAVSPPISAPCDADAVQQAMALADGDRAELWRGERLVAHFDRSASRPTWNRCGT